MQSASGGGREGKLANAGGASEQVRERSQRAGRRRGCCAEGVGAAGWVLADGGFANRDEVEILGGRGMDVLVATKTQVCRRLHDFRPPPEKLAREPRADWIKSM